MVGCIAVSQFMNPSGPVSVCQQCNSSEFELDLKNECVCKEGFIAGDHCTTVVGCTLAVITAENTTECAFCNISELFLFDNTTKLCYCVNGY